MPEQMQSVVQCRIDEWSFIRFRKKPHWANYRELSILSERRSRAKPKGKAVNHAVFDIAAAAGAVTSFSKPSFG
jgi:hypothetical protein